MTLWELAQSLELKADAEKEKSRRIEREFGELSFAAWMAAAKAHAFRECAQWAREKSKEADMVDAYPFKNQTAKEISKDFSDALKSILGVPEADHAQ